MKHLGWPIVEFTWYLKCFEGHCFITEGVRYRELMGVPALKRLKPDAVPTLFPTYGTAQL